MKKTIERVLANLDQYNPTFSGVGASDRASIPLGNGELCANVWVEKDGLHFYLARSDAITELDRTVKLGEYVVRLVPNPFLDTASVRQELVLREGTLRISAGVGPNRVDVVFFIDAQSDDAFMSIESGKAFDLVVEIRNWRHTKNFARGAVGMFFDDVDLGLVKELAEICESPDVILNDGSNIVCFHHNQSSIVEGVVALHELTEAIGEIPDLITGRIFGSQISVGTESISKGNTVSTSGVREACLRVATFSSQLHSLNTMLDSITSQFDFRSHLLATAEYWNAYWSKSWIFLKGDEPVESRITQDIQTYTDKTSLPKLLRVAPSKITSAYVLTKWMNACANRGAMPILYNGSLFTTMPGGDSHLRLDSFNKAFSSEPTGRPSIDLNPDERSWTLEHLWQNLRLPYYSMLARGENDGLIPLFSYYKRFWGLNRARAIRHYEAKGQWNTEMTLSCGLQSPGIYGADRTEQPVGWSKNRWGGAINLSPGLELCKLMFDYWRATDDEAFLVDDVIPYALDLIKFATSKYYNQQNKKIQFRNLNSLETYFDCLNPVAIVAGYRRLVQDLLSLPVDVLERRDEIEQFRRLLPGVPLGRDSRGVPCIVPAETYDTQRMNVESPELYCVYPFDLSFEISDDIFLGTWNQANVVSGAFRPAMLGEKVGTPCYSGWQYHGPVAARLGLIQATLEILSENSALTNPGFSFPAMWGPIYDAVPDVDHGANILNTLQELVLKIVANPELAGDVPDKLEIDFHLFGPLGESLVGEIREKRLVLRDCLD